EMFLDSFWHTLGDFQHHKVLAPNLCYLTQPLHALGMFYTKKEEIVKPRHRLLVLEACCRGFCAQAKLGPQCGVRSLILIEDMTGSRILYGIFMLDIPLLWGTKKLDERILLYNRHPFAIVLSTLG
ncbi:hypothetical protein ACJX0J_008118, partial [Zea mays]